MWFLDYFLFPRTEFPQGSDLCDRVHQYEKVHCFIVIKYFCMWKNNNKLVQNPKQWKIILE